MKYQQSGKILRFTALGSAIATALSIAGPISTAQAQPTLEEIVVTAQRREEALLDTPVTVTAIGGNTLEQQNVRSLTDLTVMVPGMEIEPDGSRTTIRIRGLATQDGTPAAENIAALHVDDVYISHRTTMDGYFYDIERVEVLQGPQGTLYGRNTAAGTVNIRSARPIFDRAGSAELEVGSHNTRRVNGMLNIPLNDEVAVRGAFQSSGRDGYYYSNVDAQPQDLYGRLGVQWEPTDRFSLYAKYDFGHSTSGCNGQALLGTIDTSDPDNWQVAYFNDDTWFKDQAIQHPGDQASISMDDCWNAKSSNDFQGLMTEVAYDITPNMAFIAVLARIEEEYTSYSGDSSAAVGVGIPGGVNGDVTVGTPWLEQTADLRFQGTAADQFDWTVGYFYFEDDTNEPAYNDLSLAFNARVSLSESQAVYGQVAWTPLNLDRLTITAGVRYTEDWKQWDFEVNFPFGTVGGSNGLLTREWDSTDYKIGVSYDIGDNGQVYANHSTGYRAGSWFPGPLPAYDPEYVDAYEIGWKSRLFNNSMELSANAYYYDYQDMAIQFDAFNTLSNEEEMGYYNLGNADVYGANLNGVWLFSDYDRLDFNLDYTQAEIKKFDFDSAIVDFPAHYTIDPNNIFNWEGLDVPNTTPVRLTLAWTRTLDLANGSVDSRLQGVYNASRQYSYRSDTTTQYEFEGFDLDAYATLDWNVSYRPSEEDWFVGFYIKNIFDERVINNVGTYTLQGNPARQNPIDVAPIPNGHDRYLTGALRAPRTFGIRVGYEF